MPDPEPTRELEALYRDRFDALKREMLALVGHPAVAEDLVQDAFVRLLRTPPRDPGRTEAWLRVVARRLAIDWLRAQRHAGPATHDAQVRDSEPSAEERAIRRLERDAVRAALAQLGERDREALWLRHSGHSYRDIAVRIGVSESAVGVLLWRALNKLRAALHDGEALDEEGTPTDG
jgi:RNA polymerase sigma factor (sigma-70 family)